MTDTPTASVFKNTLLLVLLDEAEKQGFVRSAVATDRVLGAHGFDRASFGHNERGQSVIALVVNQTMNKILKSNGLAESAGHGKWALTESGIEAARAVEGAVDGLEIEQRDWSRDGSGIAWAPPTHAGVEVPHPDPYIMELVRNQTACHGRYSTRSPLCKACPLVPTCVPAALSTLGGIASMLDARDDRLAAGEALGEILAEEADPLADLLNRIEEDPVDPARPARSWDNYTSYVERNSVESVCEKCGERVLRNHAVWWVLANPYGVQQGLYHPECWEKIK